MTHSRSIRKQLKSYARRNNGLVSAAYLKQLDPNIYNRAIERFLSMVGAEFRVEDISFCVDKKGYLSRLKYQNSLFQGGVC
jgi:hypothetical protein